MSTATADLPGRIAVIPSAKAAERAASGSQGMGGVGFLNSVIREMSRLAAAGALPARVEDNPRRLAVYTEHHRVSLYPTEYGDAYRLGHLEPLTFADHERLLRGAVLLRCAAGFRAVPHVRDLRGIEGLSTYWPTITRAWAAATADQQTPGGLPPQHAEYLDLLTEVVEATRDIEIEKQRTAPPVPYSSRGPGQAQRHSARGVYTFRLVRPATLATGSPVSVTDEPDLRGRVVQVTDGGVVIRFDDAIDYRRIPPQGSLQVLPSDRVYRAQLAAIDVLRDGQLPNGVWRATLAASAFGQDPNKLPLSRVGSYELRRRHFLQLWSDDTALRARAVHERALAMTATFGLTKVELRQRVAALARQLEVPEPSLSDLRHYGEQYGLQASAARLESLE